MKPEDYFPEVCKLVERGWTISDALDELGIYSALFYADLTKHQKMTLSQLKASHRGRRHTSNGSGLMDLHEFFTTSDYA